MMLPKLAQIQCLHYREKSATELYQELITLKQNKFEDATSFVIRAMETREKILFASKEADTVAYERAQVQKLCLSSIESGIDEEVAAFIRPHLSNTSIEDVDLLHQINLAQTTIKMRAQKLESGAIKKNVKIAGVSNDGESSELLKTLKEVKSELAAVGDLRKEVSELKGELRDLKKQQDGRNCQQYRDQPRYQNRRDNKSTRQRPPQCDACFNADIRDCSHCFKCGGEDHMARGCKKSENQKGLSRGGRR